MTATPKWIWVRRLLCLIAANLGLALFAVFMPTKWMEQIAIALGVGPLTDNGLVHYLARQTSALYVLHAATIAIIAAKLPKSLPLVMPLGAITVVFSMLVFAIDWMESMPLYWKIAEPAAILTGGICLVAAGHWARGEATT